MTTDDAPRPGLDAAALEELVYEFGRAEWRLGWNARSVNNSPAEQRDRDAKCAELVQTIRDLAPLLAAAARADALAGEVEVLQVAIMTALRYLTELHAVPVAISTLRAALAPAARSWREGTGDGARD